MIWNEWSNVGLQIYMLVMLVNIIHVVAPSVYGQLRLAAAGSI